MFDVSDRLHMIAGNLEPYVRTGGTVTAEEIRWLVDQLALCAAEARHACNELERAETLLDEVVDAAREQERAAMPRRSWKPRVVGGTDAKRA